MKASHRNRVVPGCDRHWSWCSFHFLFCSSFLQLIVYRQTKYLNNKDLGFNKEQVVYFQVRDSLASNPKTLETFKSELKSSSNVVAVTSGYGLPGDMYAGDGINVGTEAKGTSRQCFYWR